jgi:predicted nucleic acid-binding protein
MKTAEPFVDTSVLLYLLSGEPARSERVESLLADGTGLSVQVLNEFASVAQRKLGLSFAEIREVLTVVRAVCRIEPVTVATHDKALDMAERYGFSFYDALLVASALLAGATRFYAEDLQHGQLIERQLRVLNPFRAA